MNATTEQRANAPYGDQCDAHIYEHGTPVIQQEQTRKKLYTMIDDVLGTYFPAFESWRNTPSATAWSNIPSKAILLRSQYYTQVNAHINGTHAITCDQLRQQLAMECDSRGTRRRHDPHTLRMGNRTPVTTDA